MLRRRVTAFSALGLLWAVLVSCLSSCGGSRPSGPPAKILLVQAVPLGMMVARDGHLTQTFAHRVTYVTTSDAGPPPAVHGLAGTVMPTRIYRSYAAFTADLAAGQVSRRVRAVMYDPEKWAATPLPEQLDPRMYMAQFSRLARAHDLLPILAPARDLVLVHGSSCEKHAGENLNQAYVRCGLGTEVRQAGALVIQSQASQFDVATFRNFVAQVAAQARSVNARVTVLAQVATAPLGQEASLSQLLAAVNSVARIADGFSVNIRPSDIPSASGLLQSFKGS